MKIPLSQLSRRELLRLGLMSGGAALASLRRARSQGLVACTAIPAQPYDIDIETGNTVIEVFPTSPFIIEPFNDPLPVPTAMKPGYRQPDGTLTPGSTDAWTVRTSAFGNNVKCAPGPGEGRQDAMGKRSRSAGVPGPQVP